MKMCSFEVYNVDVPQKFLRRINIIYTKKKKYPDDFHFMKQNNHFWEGKKASKYDAKSTIFS